MLTEATPTTTLDPARPVPGVVYSAAPLKAGYTLSPSFSSKKSSTTRTMLEGSFRACKYSVQYELFQGVNMAKSSQIVAESNWARTAVYRRGKQRSEHADNER